MALISNWTGFSSDLGLNVETENIIRSSTTAFSGRGFYRHGRTTSGATQTITFGNFGSLGTVTDGQSGGYRVRLVFRLPTVAPNVARVLWHTVAGASSWQMMGVLIDTDRTLKCWTNITNGGAYAAGSASSPVPLGYADNEGWVTIDIEATVVANGANDSMTVDADITFADGSQESITATTGSTNLGTPNFVSGYGVLSAPGGSTFTTNWIGCVDLGQWIQHGATNADFASLPALPPVGTKHAEVLIAAQGSNNGIAYSSGATYMSLRKAIPVASVTTDTRLTTSTAGQQSDFTHDGVARFGATQTYGIKVIQNAAAGGAPTAQFMIGGVNVVGRGTLSATVHPDYTDFTTRSQATFDALQVGVQSALSSGTYDCNKIQIEVLHNGSTYGDAELELGEGYRQEWLSWTGNTGLRTLTGASFRPTLALIFSPGAVVTPKVVSVLYPEVALNATGTWDTAAFHGFTADGLIVDGLLNTSAQEYRALLIRDDGSPTYDTSGEAPVITGYTFYFTQGSYGAITGAQPYDFGERVQFAPEALLVFPAHNASGASTVMKTRSMGTGLSVQLTTAATPESGTRMTSFDANGFTVGTSVASQVSATIPCLWFAWSDSADLYGLIRTRQVAAVSAAKSDTVATLAAPYLFSFEEDDVAVRPTLLNADHTRATSTTSATVASFNIVAGSNRRLVIAALTYGDSGVRSCTVGGSSSGVTLLEDIDQGFMRYCVYEVVNPTVGTPSIVYTSTTSLTSIQLGVFHVEDSDGVRWINYPAASSQLSSYYSSRLNDLVLDIFSSDPLDAGSTYTSPGAPWSELWNDAAVSAAGVANVRDGLADAEVSLTYTEGGTGTPDVYCHIMIGLAPVRPAWDPRAVWTKSSHTNAPISRLRLDDAAYSGTSCSLWTTQAIATTIGITSLDDYHAGIYRVQINSALIADKGWVFALGPAAVVLALSPPTSVDDAYSTPFETTLGVSAAGVLANDDDNGGGSMTAVLEDDVAVGTLTLSPNGAFTYVPPAGFSGVVTFTYRASNDGGLGTLATVTITVLEDEGGRSFPMFGLALGGSYRGAIRDASPLGFWYLSDVRSGVAEDEVETGDAGIMTGDPLNGRGLIPDWGLSTAFDGATQYVTLDWDGYGLGVDEPHSIVALVRPAALGAVQCIVSGTATGLWLGLTAAGLPQFGKNGGTKVSGASALEVGTGYLLVGTYDGTSARLYVGAIEDGSEIVAAVVTPVTALELAGPTAVSIGPNGGADVFIAKNASEEFEGDIQGVALFGAALTTDQVDAIYEACLWCDVDDDVSDEAGLMIDHGIHDDRPTSRLAATGQCTFALDNSALNIAELEGYWSPGHENACPNFDRRTMVRVRISTESGATRTGNFLGSIRELALNVKEGELETHIAAADWLDEAARAPLVVLPAEVDIRADEALAIILDRMRNKPHELVLGLGSEVYPFALDNAQEERGSVLQEIGRLVLSEFGLAYVDGAGTFVFESRTDRSYIVDPEFTFTRDSLTNMQPGRSDGQVKNRVAVTVHPRRVDAAATTVLYEAEQPIQIDNGITTSIFLAFRDPVMRAQRMGGTDVVSPAPTTHYLVNTAEDGSGTNVTTHAALTIEWRIAGNGVYLDVTNAYGQVVYFTFVEIIGRGLYDYSPITVIDEDLERQDDEGVQEERIDMPYQALASVGQAVGALVKESYNAPPTRIKQLNFPLRASDVHELAGRTADISQRVTVTERVSGIDADYYVQAKRIDWRAGDNVEIVLWLAPASTEAYWILDVDALDVSTRLAFG